MLTVSVPNEVKKKYGDEKENGKHRVSGGAEAPGAQGTLIHKDLQLL